MRFTPLYCYVLAVVVGTVSASPIPVPDESNPLAGLHFRLGHGVPALGAREEIVKRQILFPPPEALPTASAAPRPVTPHLLGSPGPVIPKELNTWFSSEETVPHPTFRQGQVKHHAPCAGARRLDRFKQKSIEISNKFRQAVGLPLIEDTESVRNAKHIQELAASLRAMSNSDLPVIHVADGYTITGEPGDWKVISHGFRETPRRPMPPHRHHHDHPSRGRHFPGPVRGFRNGPFMMRLHNALMSLGPWEGRAVAFVLGCGIGVLLRMMWVLVVVAYRAVKGGNQEEETVEGYLRLEGDLDAEEIFVAPPQYFVDEKVAPAEEEAKN